MTSAMRGYWQPPDDASSPHSDTIVCLKVSSLDTICSKLAQMFVTSLDVMLSQQESTILV